MLCRRGCILRQDRCLSSRYLLRLRGRPLRCFVGARERRLDGRSVSFSFDEETHGVPLLRVMGEPYLPACSLNQFAEIAFGCIEDSGEPDGVQLRTAHDCSEHLRMGMHVSSERVPVERVRSALPSGPLRQ